MRKIHSHLAEVVGRSFGSEAIKKRLNRNILFTREAYFGDVNLSIYDKLTYEATYKNKQYALFLDAPMSPTYKGYINAILNGLGINSHFYIKNGKVQCKDLRRDNEGLYLNRFNSFKVRINLTDKALNDYAYTDIGGVKWVS